MNQIRLFLLSVMIVCCTSGANAQTTTTVGTCMNLHTPTQAEANAACQNKGSCPGTNYVIMTGADAAQYQQCTYAINGTATPPGQWAISSHDTSISVDCCQTITQCDKNCQVTKKTTADVKKNATVTFEGSASAGTELKIGVNAKLSELAGLEASGTGTLELSFKAGTSLSYETSVSDTTEFMVATVCCGRTTHHFVAWKQPRGANGTIDYQLQWKCNVRGANGQLVLCDGGTWENVGGAQHSPISIAGNGGQRTDKVCDETCNPPHQQCCGSATQSPTPKCTWDQPPTG